MDIVIDLTKFTEFLRLPADVMLRQILFTVGWIPIAVVLLWGFKEIWIFYIQNKWGGTQKHIFLAIDIPHGNEQSPKAVENMFAYLAGAHGTLSLIEKYWEGKFQLSFSLEIVSIEGYVQFLIRTPIQFRDMVESAVYSQYPDAEITEVDDYTGTVPRRYPNDEYDIYGAEFVTQKPSAYPIKTYEEFEHQMGDPKVTFRDPMSSLMDLGSSLKKGEQLWYQILLTPIGFEWPEIGEKEISKILKEKVKSNKHIADYAIDLIVNGLSFLSDIIYSFGDAEKNDKKKEEDDVLKMINLKPKEKKQVEFIQKKVGKLGYEYKIRVVYTAKKDVMNKPKVFGGFVGYMKQFASMDLNNLKPDMNHTATRANYFFKEQRINHKKNSIMQGYIDRDGTIGRAKGIINVEELATIWHFPVESAVKAPMIQKASRKKAEPPMGLPTGVETVGEELRSPIEEDIFNNGGRNGRSRPVFHSAQPEFMEDETAAGAVENGGQEKGLPPCNLPFAD